ncbi:MAG: GNAT family N-acetyltransferase [Niabella sp.]|nr:GNAT family N-acetyltransferase [Niabella sp.]
MKIRYHQLARHDEVFLKELFHLYIEVFETPHRPPGDAHFCRLLQEENILFFVASSNKKVIGGLTAYVLPSLYTEAGEVYLYDLAVRNDYQRLGVGRQLLSKLESWCRQHGIREFFVQADETDNHAIAFYRATGGIPEAVRHFSYATGN